MRIERQLETGLNVALALARAGVTGLDAGLRGLEVRSAAMDAALESLRAAVAALDAGLAKETTAAAALEAALRATVLAATGLDASLSMIAEGTVSAAVNAALRATAVAGAALDAAFRVTSAILPPYLRRAKSIEELLPWLYLKGISTGDFPGAFLDALLQFVACPFERRFGRLALVDVDDHGLDRRRATPVDHAHQVLEPDFRAGLAQRPVFVALRRRLATQASIPVSDPLVDGSRDIVGDRAQGCCWRRPDPPPTLASIRTRSSMGSNTASGRPRRPMVTRSLP